MNYFLNNLETPTISTELNLELDKPFLLEEVVSSIQSMQNIKSPGPDGYPNEYFKRFSNKLAPLLLEMFNDAISIDSLPPMLTQASISFLLKPGGEPTKCISLIGRVQCVKMNGLPRLVSLFMCLPLFLPKSFFHLVDSLISTFIWRSHVPRINKSLLQRGRSKGCLALPNFVLLLGSKHLLAT